MTLRLEVVSDQKRMLGSDAEHAFGPRGGTIGRALDNDWVLPDTERFVSGRHATVDHQAGAFYLADVSSNGVFVNGADEPLGGGNPRRLFDGDRLRMGNFEIAVHLSAGEDLEMPPEPKATVVPDHIEQLVPVDDVNSSIMLLDEEEISGAGDFAEVLLGDDSDDAVTEEVHDEYLPVVDDEAPPPEAVLSAAAAQPAADADSELLSGFLRAAGLDPANLPPDVDAAEVMENAGRVVNAFVTGFTELLVARANVKSMFQLDQTTLLPRHNNPLKLSASRADTIMQLLVGKPGEYLGAVDSVLEASRDLKLHHDSIIGAMIGALGELIARFDPAELEEGFNRSLERKPRFNALAKGKFWDLYRDLYPIITQPGSTSLPLQFSEDFVASYERQLANARRLERALGETRRLDSATGSFGPVAPGSAAASAEDAWEADADDALEFAADDEN